MAEEAKLDENYLFSNFQEELDGTGKQSKPKKSKKRKISELLTGQNGEPILNIPEHISALLEQKEKYIQQLEDQNNKLKAVIKRLCGPQNFAADDILWKKGCVDKMPLAVVIFFNNEISFSCKKDIESYLIEMSKKSFATEIDNEQNVKAQPSAVPLKAFTVDTKGKRLHESKTVHDSYEPHVCSSVQYFLDFCIDRTGLPLFENNPSITEIWTIPVYKQVFLNALPLEIDGQKIFIKQRQTKYCFNCLGDHNVVQCDQPRDPGRINSNREEFMSKFGSPSSESRYHQSESDRFKDFQAGTVSNALREALGISSKELPPYIYKMRLLGYPPGYLKSNDSGLIMYDEDGKDGDGRKEEFMAHAKDILYEGFNAPLNDGTIDRSSEYGMPAFDEWYGPHERCHPYEQNRSILSSSTPITDNHKQRKQMIDSNSINNQTSYVDMDLDESIPFEDMKPSVIDLTQNEETVIQPLPKFADKEDFDANNPPRLPSYSTPEHPPPGESDDRSIAMNPIDIGDLLDEAAKNVKKSKIIDSYLAQGQTDATRDASNGSSHRQWWLNDPISSTAGILYITYTPPPTIKDKSQMTFDNIVKSPSNDLDREPWKTDSTSWYDPLYGDLATPTGTYDSIKEILKRRKRRLQRKEV